MKTAGIVLGALAALVLAAGLWFVGVYNGLVAKREAVNSAWAQVENVYQRRADLVPNLVATVKGAASFEKSTLQAVVEARSRVGSVTVDKSVLDNPAQFKKFEQAQAGLGSALSRLMLVVERYPQLRATENFRDLQVQLEGTENRIAVERRSFNDVAQDYNTAIQRMPASLVAGFGGFRSRPYFQAQAGAETVPVVKF
ncbi:MAG: LemA family protein [Elusimicrobia bacterium]|nr:LemA family protein [Elusimicrobiota bacterium]MDE2236787.1 LemA family protein [Elusimicrobiota bacterium]MDE2426044.1 LemA family protein [Elusimicrobiota bacterium]